MASVIVFRPGRIVRTTDDSTQWRFTAKVDGRVGYIDIFSSTDENHAANAAQEFLERSPELLEGVGIDDGGDGGGGGGQSGDGGGGGGDDGGDGGGSDGGDGGGNEGGDGGGDDGGDGKGGDGGGSDGGGGDGGVEHPEIPKFEVP